MIIGFDGSRAFVDERTGTENYSYQLLKNLASIDTVNEYKVYIRSTQRVRENEWPSSFKFVKINFPRLWTQLGLALKTFTDDLDLLFVPAHTLPLIRKPGLKTLMTVHDLGAEYLPASHQLKQRLYLNFITNFQLKSATKLIAVSSATKQDLIKKAKVDPKNIEVIYEGVDQELFKPVKTDILNNTLMKYDIEKGKYFLFVGTIQPRKNLEILIQSYAQLLQLLDEKSQPAPFLVLAGSKGWLSDQIFQLPKKLGIEARVKFLGRVEDSGLASLYSGAIGLLYPSLFEGFGLPILEAMSCGCPVITSNLSSMPEIAGNAAILVNPKNPSEIAQNSLSLIKNDKLRDSLIVKGYAQAKLFTWKKCAGNTLQLLNNLK